MVQVINLIKDEAAQELLGYAGIREPYEELIARASLDILRKSVPNCEIESIKFLISSGRHKGMRVGGMPIEEGSSKITLQDMTMPFDLDIVVSCGNVRHCLNVTFTFECRKMDGQAENEFLLAIHSQKDV